MKPKLLVIELWGLGDLIIATPFLQAASRKFAVTLLAKPYAHDLGERFWPEVEVRSFIAPWTAFRRKYRFHAWPWRNIFQLHSALSRQFDLGLSARWDPRDHLLLWALRARRRLGFPRVRSQMFLTDRLERPAPGAHRYENWRVLARALGLDLPPQEKLPALAQPARSEILVHTGAGQPVRVWPQDRYAGIVARLRKLGYSVQVACDPDQSKWWADAGESRLATPRTVKELLALVDRAGAFIGNDSGPAHLAACCGVPTLTIFGPQLPEFFAPLHPRSEVVEGKACPYKPCSDYCRFPAPLCITGLGEEEIWGRVQRFLHGVLPSPT